VERNEKVKSFNQSGIVAFAVILQMGTANETKACQLTRTKVQQKQFFFKFNYCKTLQHEKVGELYDQKGNSTKIQKETFYLFVKKLV
jgi:hypothetical protein